MARPVPVLVWEGTSPRQPYRCAVFEDAAAARPVVRCGGTGSVLNTDQQSAGRVSRSAALRYVDTGPGRTVVRLGHRLRAANDTGR